MGKITGTFIQEDETWINEIFNITMNLFVLKSKFVANKNILLPYLKVYNSCHQLSNQN